MCNFVTPPAVTGMGNPTLPGENGEVGSGDVFVPVKKKKKMKPLRDYLKNKK